MERTLATARLCACVQFRVSLDDVKVDDVKAFDTLKWPPGLRNHKTHNRTVTIANKSGVQNASSAVGVRDSRGISRVFNMFKTIKRNNTPFE